jgi:hypothetical protein
MKIVINNNRKIFAIQEEFKQIFPAFNIDFFAKPNKQGATASNKRISHSSKTLQECRAVSNEGTIEILPTMDISDIKDNFRDIFGLTVDIVKKS